MTPSPAMTKAMQSTRDEVLVTPQWLEDHLDDPSVRVVDVHVGYEQGHIGGAVLWNVYADLKDSDYRLVGSTAVRRLLERSGIAPDSTVVCYGYAPAMAFWLMKYHGHHDVRILDCSTETWMAESRSWTSEVSTPDPTLYPLTGVRDQIRADQGTVERAIKDPVAVILDARTEAEFDGERFWPSGASEPGGRAGHVPGAVRFSIDEVFDERGSFLSHEELSDLLAPVELHSDDEVISYCTIGGRASTAWFVLAHLLGHVNARVYDGSWAEWGRNPVLPVERPESAQAPTEASTSTHEPAMTTIAPPTTPGAFLQLIEYHTDDPAAMDALVSGWISAIGAHRTARWYATAADRDQPKSHLQIVEFPSYAHAMKNSEHPATAEFAAGLRQLCGTHITFRNLDVTASATL